MKLEEMTWQEVEAYLNDACGVILPCGSIEQHGPMGLIGTDAICAREIAFGAAERCHTIVAPELSYAPAPFNTAFPGTVSISPSLFEELARQVVTGLTDQGFEKVYILNGHGANLEPLGRAVEGLQENVRLRSWWDFEPVNKLRRAWYGSWEGMHATPSEISITQHTHREVVVEGLEPPEKLSAEYIAAHAGDKHGPPAQHRADFPDGRVGSHSALARPGHGSQLLRVAAEAVASDFIKFIN